MEMTSRAIQLTSQDRKRLEFIEYMTASEDRRDLAGLTGELSRAVVVPSEQIPPDVVTMRSRVRLLDLDDGSTHEYTLVYPDEADLAAGKISIVAPVAAAIIGCREGDEVEWDVPGGRRRFKVDAVLYQPEAAGDIHL
jgi:regulator of nucleoside diphosphate kinase